MAERIQDLLARHKYAQIKVGNSRAARILKNAQLVIARAAARGAFAPDGVVSVTPDNTQEAQRLVVAESVALKVFFGKDIPVPQPPAELFKTQDALKEKGVAGFEAHYLPGEQLSQKDKLPGWKVKPEEWFWRQIKDGTVAKDAATLRAGWYLVEGRNKPDYQDGQQMYENDPFAPLMQDLRGSGRIQKYQYVPDNSRFGPSAGEIEQVILPEFARINLPASALMRTPREIEFNVLGNMYHPEWGQTNTWEVMNDQFGRGGRLGGW